ncbi:hypothetical protein HBE96_18910 [Clostridium sp. P21]|uniref:Uncharacterized protein n=1 Tax=Clostridium muellerianum TaxID=2716538 RepID=A0A7Y0HR08_9CLOT|nr:hypothetical protein [Clostridium muellerianum]NMM64681.1 hypothetical protein [Clostridium muellerianum]
MEQIKMDKHYEEKIELKISEQLEKYEEIIKKIEKASLQTGIKLEDGVKFLYYLCTED